MSTAEILRVNRRLERLARTAPPSTVDAVSDLLQAAQRYPERSPLIESVLGLLTEALAEGLQPDSPGAAATRLVATPPRFEELMRTLEQPELQAELREQDPLAPARIRGMRLREHLLQSEGGVASSTEMARRLGMTRQGVDKRRRKGTLIAVKLGKRGYQYPVWQADVDGLDVVLAAMPDIGPWGQWAYMLSAEGLLDDETPLAVLRRGEIERVLDAVEMIGEQVGR